MRRSISLGAGFSKKDRIEHNLRVARLAMILSGQSPVIVSVIAPFKSTRKEIDDLIKPIWIYMASDFPKDLDKPYEIPENPHIAFSSNTQTLQEKLEMVVDYIRKC